MRRVVLLDGGMGQELIHRSRARPHPLWSAKVLLDEPDLVRSVHLEMIRAGARVITVNSYSVTRCRLSTYGMEEDFVRLQHLACDLARQAREEAGEDVAIAGCLPPFHGSYRPQDVEPVADTLPRYREIAELQADQVDVFIAETMVAGEQGEGAVRGAMGVGKPIWVAWTVDDQATGLLRNGETLAEATARLDGLPADAILANCAIPPAIDAAVAPLRALARPWGVYANGFTGIPEAFAQGAGVTVDMLSASGDVTVAAYAAMARHWVEQGAAIIGGCCEIGPAHIAAMAEMLRDAGYEIGKGLAPAAAEVSQ
ncbi:MAG: homocysteine S-methyltransferase family protein [Pseudomonadota bacterium]